MIHALMAMKANRSNQNRYNNELTSRIYEKYRIEFGKSITGRKRAPFNQEWLERLAASNRGERNGMYGKSHSEETRHLY